MQNEPTNCQECNVSLADNRYTYIYRGSNIIGAYCKECDDKRILNDYIKTRKLNTNLIINVSLDLSDIGRPWSHREPDPYHYKLKTFREIFEFGSEQEIKDIITLLEIWYSNIKIRTKIQEFEKEVWFNGLQEIIRNSTKKGVSARLDDIKCLTFSMCARTMITIEDMDASVTMMCTEDSKIPSMGFRGISATEQQAINLIDFIIKSFKDGLLKFEDDTDVSYCGI